MLRISLAVMLVGCGSGVSGDLSPSSSQALEGTPEGVGVLRFLNDPSTGFAVLDEGVPLDRRAAAALIAHRDGVDRLTKTADDNLFDTLAEVDEVYWVGQAAYTSLLAYVEAFGWVPEGDEYLGTWEGVAFTVAEAEGALDFANGSTPDELDGALDKRAVGSILAARPLATVLSLSELYYVGPAALEALKAGGTRSWPQP